MSMTKTKHFTYLALFSAMAITLNLVETMMIPPFFGVFRIGIANIIALVTIEKMGTKDMIIVNIMRVMIGNLLSGRIFGSSFWISFTGVLLSSLIIIFAKKMNSSLMFTSVLSAIAHSLGQIIVVMMFYMQPMIITILPYFLIFSVPTGLFTGFIARIACDRLKTLR